MTDERLRLHSVAVVVDHGFFPFEFAIGCEVFGVDRTAQGLPAFDFAVCAVSPGPVRMSIGVELTAHHGLERLESADLVLVVPVSNEYEPPAELSAALRRAVERGAIVASLCTGAFTLARAGLLAGRNATTHWFHEDEFRVHFPDVGLVSDVLYVEDGPVVTSAGTAAGIDMCLNLVRRAHGAEAANGIARRMVVPPHRDGGQAQFIETPVRNCTARTLSPVLDWAAAHLAEDLSVTRLAARAAMSERTFARRFREETGTTPHQWVQLQRVALAERLLEGGDLGVEEVARRSGFGSAAMLRHHFGRRRRTTPVAYRRTFGAPPAPGLGTAPETIRGKTIRRGQDRRERVTGSRSRRPLPTGHHPSRRRDGNGRGRADRIDTRPFCPLLPLSEPRSIGTRVCRRDTCHNADRTSGPPAPPAALACRRLVSVRRSGARSTASTGHRTLQIRRPAWSPRRSG